MATRRQFDDEVQRLAQERSLTESRSTATERRLLEEVDRARQEAKQAQSALTDAQKNAETSRKNIEVANKTSVDKLQSAQGEIASLRQAVVFADERSAELRGLLDKQHVETAAALAQLTLVAGRAPKPRKPPRSRSNPIE